MKREQIKALLELSASVEEAKEIMDKYVGYNTIEEKIAFLNGMFGHEIIFREVESTEADYVALLASIVNKKWLL